MPALTLLASTHLGAKLDLDEYITAGADRMHKISILT